MKTPVVYHFDYAVRLLCSLFPTMIGCALVFALAMLTQAGTAIWDLNPRSDDWNTATNWTTMTVPNGSADSAIFGLSNTTINGVQCTNGYVTHPFCSPTRAALLTGRNQQRFGHENPRTFGSSRVENTNSRLGLPLTEAMLPQLLKPAGYVCGIIGKWHLRQPPSLLPNQRGFDYLHGFPGGASNYYGDTRIITK
jgi:arylsulfatase A-like enzyme